MLVPVLGRTSGAKHSRLDVMPHSGRYAPNVALQCLSLLWSGYAFYSRKQNEKGKRQEREKNKHHEHFRTPILNFWLRHCLQQEERE